MNLTISNIRGYGRALRKTDETIEDLLKLAEVGIASRTQKIEIAHFLAMVSNRQRTNPKVTNLSRPMHARYEFFSSVVCVSM